jgi:broad specificity phosphatase PhoE
MTTFYFIRHGEAEWRLADELGLVGAQRDLIPLTLDGMRQAESASRDPGLKEAQLIVSSPYTRALQTAAIINGRLGLPVVVEYDLHEWIPDKTMGVTSSDRIRELSLDYEQCGGIYPDGIPRPWETGAQIKSRVEAALRKHLGSSCVIVVCHGMVIRSQVEVDEIPPGGIVEFTWLTMP